MKRKDFYQLARYVSFGSTVLSFTATTLKLFGELPVNYSKAKVKY